MELKKLKGWYAQEKDKIIEEFFTFLKFKSISSEKEYEKELQACADWVQDYLKNISFKTERWETDGHPVIFASNCEAGLDKPTLLIYNHYDVQPVDPIDKWDSSPFEPTIRDGNVYARGALDNKGQCLYVLQALRFWAQTRGEFPINIKLCIEGEEEIGSAGLSALLKQRNIQEKLKADYLAIVDLGLRGVDLPAVTLGCRGIITMDIEVKGTDTDLHSGSHGGLAYNPIHALVELLAKTRDPSGKIAIPGFYDDVKELTENEKKSLNFEFDAESYKKSFGVEATGGEKAFTPLERAWIRPTLEINGIIGGYTGSGFKTVIPSIAQAKISLRLVPDQDPEKLGTLVANFLECNAPKGITAKVNVHPGHGKAVRSNPDSKVIKAFEKSYTEVFSRPTDFILEGGSIPIVTELQQVSQSEVVLMGMGLNDDNIHAPNENFGIDRLEKGFLVMAKTLELLNQE